LNMINYELIKEARRAAKMSQTSVAEAVEKLSGETFSQQAYRKIETGQTKKTGLLPYICHVLDVELEKVNPRLAVVSSDAKDRLLARVNELPEAERIAIVQAVLSGLSSD